MFRRVRNNFIIFIRTAKWKKSVDESVNFNEEGPIPAILVENKVDLLDPEEAENMENLKKFAQDNNFNGCFRSSAKTGQNISESMEYLILEIIKKMEEIASKGTDGYVNDRQSVTLDPDKHNQEADQKRKRSNGGCCG
jgi:GTPase Era involved in 16S rRNA processing